MIMNELIILTNSYQWSNIDNMNKLECEMSRVELKLSPKCKAAIKVILKDCMPDCGCEKCMAVGILLDELLRPTPEQLQKSLDIWAKRARTE